MRVCVTYMRDILIAARLSKRNVRTLVSNVRQQLVVGGRCSSPGMNPFDLYLSCYYLRPVINR